MNVKGAVLMLSCGSSRAEGASCGGRARPSPNLSAFLPRVQPPSWTQLPWWNEDQHTKFCHVEKELLCPMLVAVADKEGMRLCGWSDGVRSGVTLIQRSAHTES